MHSRNFPKLLIAIATSLILLFNNTPALAAINVVATTADLGAIIKEIGADQVDLTVIVKGNQDAHFVEAKPSYAMKLNRADLLVSVGLGLEVGWLPSIISSSRNAKIAPGKPGNLELGPQIEPLEIPQVPVNRSQGDVHPEGNPHFTLDPIRMGNAAVLIANKLAELDPGHSAQFMNRAEGVKTRLADKVKSWHARVTKSGIKKVITHHKTLNYFLARFGIDNFANLEPVPGVPPTAKHVMSVMSAAKKENVSLIMVENYFDPKLAQKIAKDSPEMRVVVVPVSVGGAPEIETIDQLYEALVKYVETKR